MGRSRPHVVIVDDERDIADIYAKNLEGSYETSVAYGGEEALDVIDDGVDAVLLDRRMPDMSGDEVLAELREQGMDCAVIMVTAVDPDLNILDMGFDDYLSKPVDEETLESTLERHVDPVADSERVEEYFSLLSKLEVLEAELSGAELQESDEFKRTARRAREMTEQLREEIDDFESLVETYRNIDRSPGDDGR
ncbi:response regulator [Halorientalis brevis]|uniref:Response regulator n=1 Tax=Halorientalis brevis TaxID=1126241 RepID=A0ABD6C6S5_9EURY